MIGPLLDTVLDRTVVAGYTSAGYRIRSRAWDAGDLPSMEGRRVLAPRSHRLTGPRLRSPQQGPDTIAWLGAAAAPGANAQERD